MINFGIDLGTTNSAIACFDKGQVRIFRNPIGQKDTLPSVVAFRKGRIIVGEKARELILKAPEQVIGSFKRKMGTTESYLIQDFDKALSPVALSAYVLKELKQFVQTGDQVEAAVITIPAAFDTIQSNATKEAGKLAGFQDVVLLQEPIAASLAYANQDETEEFKEGQWMVYDLGGGTFDVALIKIQDGEMRVMDHEGDNFLGGNDFDQAIVEKCLVPFLEETGEFEDLLGNMRSARGKYNRLYQILMLKAEEAKVQLSASEQAEIEFETEDDTGKKHDCVFELSRSQFQDLIRPHLDRTVEMMNRIMERNELDKEALKFILMVGGSTYIPFVRQHISDQLEIAVNTRVDPTTAVAVGAAFYAGTQSVKKKKSNKKKSAGETTKEAPISVKFAYQKATQESTEYFTAVFEGKIDNLFYRIQRLDGGFDSGLMPLAPQIELDLPLLAETFNQFQLQVLDEQQNPLELELPVIGISQGRYSVVGQPLPNDICLEIDDVENNTTALEVIFSKNSVLPLRKTITKQITRTIRRGSSDHLTISIVEGEGNSLPAANLNIGYIRISGKDLSRDLIAGSDIEISLEMSESRDLTIQTYLMMTDQEFEDLFNPSARRVNAQRLSEELLGLAEKVRREIREAEEQSNFETAQQMVDLEYEILDLADQAKNLSEDDVSDVKFQMEDRKRKIAQQVDELTRDKYIIRVKNEYFETKRHLEYVMDSFGANSEHKAQYSRLLEEEKPTLATNSSLKIQEYLLRLRRLNWQIRWNSPQFIRNLFLELKMGLYGPYRNQERAIELMNEGEMAIAENNDPLLRKVINQLVELLPDKNRRQVEQGGTGIS